MEEPEPLNGPSGVLPSTRESDAPTISCNIFSSSKLFKTMEELEPLNGPSCILPGTREEVNAGAMKTLKLHLKLSQGCLEATKKMPLPNFNKQQCGYLVDKLELVVQIARLFFEVFCFNHCDPDSSWDVTKWVGIFKLLLALGKQIEDFIAECSKVAWMEAAMTLTNVAEYVSSLGFYLELCKALLLEDKCEAMQHGSTWVEVDTLNKDEVEMVKLKAIVDKEYLLKKVTLALDTSDLAKYLLQRLVSVHSSPTCDGGTFLDNLFAWVVPSRYGDQLGRGALATVYKAMWLGTPVAKKTFYIPADPFFLKEVEILSQLCHPNITSMFCGTMNQRSSSIIMELMDYDLFALIQRRCEEHIDSPPFSISEAVDLMHQIAKGVNYLHNKRIIHRDLRSKKILVKMVRVGELETGYFIVKVTDFGFSKTKEQSATYSLLTFNEGIDRWMAPELVKLGVENPECIVKSGVQNDKFKCDVYSFAMVCYEILTGDLPFKNERLARKVKQLALKGERPQLPTSCPALLKALIERCWIGNPEERPTFGTICSTLQYLKYIFMRGDITLDGLEAKLDHILLKGSRCLVEVVNSKTKVDAPSPSVFESEEVVDVLPTIISSPPAPSSVVGDSFSIFGKRYYETWFPDHRQDFCTSEASKVATSALPTMGEMETINGPIGLLSRTKEKVNVGALKILKLRLELLQDCLETVKKMPPPNFNKQQCRYLVDKLELVVQIARSFFKLFCTNHCSPDSSWDVTKWVGIFKLLLALGKQIEDFIAGCSRAWMEAAMTLSNVAEYVSSLGFNLELCKVLLSKGKCDTKGHCGLTSDEVDMLNKAEVEMVKLKAIVDKEYLLKEVIKVLETSNLAKYLLRRLANAHPNPTCKEGNILGKLFGWVVSGRHVEQLGKGSLATVYKAMWLGTLVARKTFYGPENPFFLKEVEILSQLCHPNITSMFCSTMNPKSSSIIMELMDCDLFALIQRRCEEHIDSPPFSISEAVDLMLQIAKGVNYLHNERIIHRDLKSKNILVKMVRIGEVETGYVQAKVADFGLSKSKELSATCSHMTFNEGTDRWMAPELIKLGVDDPESLARSEGVLHNKFKCDVYSFAMVCYEILTGDLPFKDEGSPRKVKELALRGERPQLPTSCPALLKALIEKCWIGNPEERPTFDTICSTLQYLKYMLMRGDITPNNEMQG